MIDRYATGKGIYNFLLKEMWCRIHSTAYGHMACKLMYDGLDWVCKTALKRLDKLRNERRAEIISEEILEEK